MKQRWLQWCDNEQVLPCCCSEATHYPLLQNNNKDHHISQGGHINMPCCPFSKFSFYNTLPKTNFMSHLDWNVQVPEESKAVWWSWIRANKVMMSDWCPRVPSANSPVPDRKDDPRCIPALLTQNHKQANEKHTIITSTPMVLTCKYITSFPWLK